jgi:hypothetical protein
MLTEAGWDPVVNLVSERLVVWVELEERANPAGQILLALRLVDQRVLREVVGLRANRVNMELEVKMDNPASQTVRSTQPLLAIVGRRHRRAVVAVAETPTWNRAILVNTALHGIGSGTTVKTIKTDSILGMSETLARIIRVVSQQWSLTIGNVSK